MDKKTHTLKQPKRKISLRRGIKIKSNVRDLIKIVLLGCMFVVVIIGIYIFLIFGYYKSTTYIHNKVSNNNNVKLNNAKTDLQKNHIASKLDIYQKAITDENYLAGVSFDDSVLTVSDLDERSGQLYSFLSLHTKLAKIYRYRFYEEVVTENTLEENLFNITQTQLGLQKIYDTVSSDDTIDSDYKNIVLKELQSTIQKTQDLKSVDDNKELVTKFNELYVIHLQNLILAHKEHIDQIDL